jgi:hypothetical protein
MPRMAYTLALAYRRTERTDLDWMVVLVLRLPYVANIEKKVSRCI